ncbi:putative photosystem II reaction center W protein, chloroplastic [Iris pallida]|uniref:PSII 6.1 kDa protein n=1 Tax=Iris pallida TaxID=29817 RepID=A0AAX6DTR6_IRIPA|nr:putative photosystem II reaction center W protein, chloroplastic [Iris pallida]
MATISASALASTVTLTTAAVPKAAPAVLGLPHIGARGGRVWCSAASTARGGGAGASLLGAAAGMVASVPSPVLALVDERMSTEGTGLSLGLSSNLLGWILLGVFGLVWALYFVYTSGLEEDEESGLSL